MEAFAHTQKHTQHYLHKCMTISAMRATFTSEKKSAFTGKLRRIGVSPSRMNDWGRMRAVVQTCVSVLTAFWRGVDRGL